LDGKSLSREIEAKLVRRVAAIKGQLSGMAPMLATILVGDDPASATYVRMKSNACRRVGLDSLPVHMPESTTTTQLLAGIRKLNTDPRIFGILLQHPVPGHINERECFDAIALEKDVEGVTTGSYGRMAPGKRAHRAGTPGGIMTLLQHYGIALEGKEVVVVGRSPILGKPMAAMLLNANATVTICHSKTCDLPSVIKRAGTRVIIQPASAISNSQALSIAAPPTHQFPAAWGQ
jgi:methylenetetrahydrofolate dehydrogenase (NADP+)/methenyltetrahydrofolate cyclohydrolase